MKSQNSLLCVRSASIICSTLLEQCECAKTNRSFSTISTIVSGVGPRETIAGSPAEFSTRSIANQNRTFTPVLIHACYTRRSDTCMHPQRDTPERHTYTHTYKRASSELTWRTRVGAVCSRTDLVQIDLTEWRMASWFAWTLLASQFAYPPTIFACTWRVIYYSLGLVQGLVWRLSVHARQQFPRAHDGPFKVFGARFRDIR